LGESIFVGKNDCEVIISRVDSIQLLDGSKRKLMHGYHPKSPPFTVDTTYWIEGIGGIGALEDSYQTTCSVDHIFILICYSENRELLYQHRWYDECFIWTSIQEKFNSENIKIVPNPTAGNLFINIDPGIKADKFEIFDLRGKRVKTDQIVSRNVEVDVSNFPKGIYLIRVIGGAGIFYSQKIVKTD